jgi:putative ABC transport system permease protein
MGLMNQFRYLLKSVFSSRRMDAELDEELQDHLARDAADRIEHGAAETDARHAAAVALGGVTRFAEEARDARGWRWLHDFAGDLRHGLRLMRKYPGVSGSGILVLALGVGAATAIFSIVNATMLRPLPFRAPDQLVAPLLRMPVQNGGVIDMVWSYPKYQTLLAQQQIFSDVAMHLTESVAVSGADGAERIPSEAISAAYFRVLGVPPARGRFFTDQEDRSGGARSVVLSDGLWTRRFGRDPAAVGRTLTILGKPYTVIGIAAAGFRGMSGGADLWTLFAVTRSAETLASVGSHQFEVVARLKPNVSIASAQRTIVDLGTAIDNAHPDTDTPGWGAAVYALNDLRVDTHVHESVLLLAGAVSLLLLISCINVGHLLLARGAARERELAVRLAVGAGRSRLARQLLTESLALTCTGIAVGWILAVVAVRAVNVVAPLAEMGHGSARSTLTAVVADGISLDRRVAIFTAAAAILVGLLAGLVPAVSAARLPLMDAMRRGSRGSSGAGSFGRASGRTLLVVTEIGLAVTLLVLSSLAIKSLTRTLQAARLGYNPSHLLTARISISPARFTGDSAGPLWNEILQRIAALPGVIAVGAGSCAPVGDHCEGTSIRVAGRTQDAHVSFHVVSPDYFKALGIPILRGREFTAADRRDAPTVVVINRAAARAIWGNADPLVTPIADNPLGGRTSVAPVIGVAGDVAYEDPTAAPAPAIFLALAQQGRSRAMLFIRTSGDAAALIPAVRRAIHAIDREDIISEVDLMEHRIAGVTALSRFSSLVLSAFSAIALVLASIGVYSILSLAVTQRNRELGIRLALGGEPRDVLLMVLGQAARVTGVGLLAGTALSLLAVRGLRSALFGVATSDSGSYLVAILVLGTAALLAGAIPAWRASRVDPLVAMRSE